VVGMVFFLLLDLLTFLRMLLGLNLCVDSLISRINLVLITFSVDSCVRSSFGSFTCILLLSARIERGRYGCLHPPPILLPSTLLRSSIL